MLPSPLTRSIITLLVKDRIRSSISECARELAKPAIYGVKPALDTLWRTFCYDISPVISDRALAGIGCTWLPADAERLLPRTPAPYDTRYIIIIIDIFEWPKQ